MEPWPRTGQWFPGTDGGGGKGGNGEVLVKAYTLSVMSKFYGFNVQHGDNV